MKKYFLPVLLIMLPAICLSNHVYVVLGSDTSVWWNTSGGNTADTFDNVFDWEIFSKPDGRLYQLFHEDFRNSHTDSAGRPFPFTWYMHGGGWFTEGQNSNAASTTFQIKKYWLDEIERWDDEIAYHYHHFQWNGTKWVMASNFPMTIPDFEWTMSQMIIDEGDYPVSFRSGWNYMDNEYQNYLEKWIPFRMEGGGYMGNCTPYHPSFSDYRKSGDMKGWEVRHIYTHSFSAAFAASVFRTASTGEDQVVCIWTHQNETDFINQIDQVHKNLVAASESYPEVGFYYCNGREAMDLYIASVKKAEKYSIDIKADSTPEPVFVDNDDGPPAYIEKGSWTTSPSTGYGGSTYRYVFAGDDASATWHVSLPQSGYYDILAGFLQSSNRVTQARYTVHGEGGNYSASLNQQGDLEIVERRLGTFPLDKAASLTLHGLESLPPGGAVIADTLIFKWAESQEPTPTPTPTPTPGPSRTPAPTPTPHQVPPPLLELITKKTSDTVHVTIVTEKDIYPVMPWVAARRFNDEYIRMDANNISAGKWEFSYDSTEIDRVVVSVCDDLGQVTMREVKDGSRAFSTRPEFFRGEVNQIDIDTSPGAATLIKSLSSEPYITQISSTLETEPAQRSYWLGQRFIPLSTSISAVSFGANVTEPSVFRAELRPILDNGFPDDNPSALLAFAETEFTESGMETVDMEYEGLVLDGRSYALVFKLVSGAGQIHLHTQNPYPDGVLLRAFSMDWITIDMFDCRFRIFDGDDNLSIDYGETDDSGYDSEKGYFIAQTFMMPDVQISGLELDIRSFQNGAQCQVQFCKTLPDGSPDFSGEGLYYETSAPVSQTGKRFFPVHYEFSEMNEGEKVAMIVKAPEGGGGNSFSLGYASGDPYPGGMMYVSNDLQSVEKHDDDDLYFRLFTYERASTGTLSLDYDAENPVDWTKANLNGNLPGNSVLKARFRFADTKAGLDASGWTEYENGPEIDLSGFPKSRWIRTEIDFISDGDHIPTLNYLELSYEFSGTEFISGMLTY